MKINTTPPDRRRLEFARKNGFTTGTGEPGLLPLKRKLLEIGGWAACVPVIEPDLEKLISRGRRFPGKSTTMKGEPSRCHSNSAYCWDENRGSCSICTGYALSMDGMWRQHSWLLTNQGRVVETTEKRVQYFGYVLDEEECELFLFENM
jgi:hypothetical protein